MGGLGFPLTACGWGGVSTDSVWVCFLQGLGAELPELSRLAVAVDEVGEVRLLATGVGDDNTATVNTYSDLATLTQTVNNFICNGSSK